MIRPLFACGVKEEGMAIQQAVLAVFILREHNGRVRHTGVMISMTWPFGRMREYHDMRRRAVSIERLYPTLYLYLRHSPRTHRWIFRPGFFREPWHVARKEAVAA